MRSRDLGGEELADLSKKYGYAVTRQAGSHLRLTTQQGGEHHVTIPVTSRFALERLIRF